MQGSTIDQLVYLELLGMTPLFLGSSFALLSSELDDLFDKQKQGPSVSQFFGAATTDISEEETDAGQPQKRVLSKRTFKMKNSYATDELARFFVTRRTDASNILSEFFCRVCRKDVSVLTLGSSEILRLFRGIRHVAGNQLLCLETLGWRVFDYNSNSLIGDELEKQRDKSLRPPLVVRDREYPVREDLIPDASRNVDPQLPLLAKVSSFSGVLQLNGSCKLVERLLD